MIRLDAAGGWKSDGRRALVRFLDDVSRVEVARLVRRHTRCSPSCVSRLAAGRRRPTLEIAVALQRVAGIAVEAWVTDGASSSSVTPGTPGRVTDSESDITAATAAE